MGETELGVSALEQRVNADGDQQPRVDRQHEGSQQAEAPDVRGARLVHRFAILTVLGAILAAQVAWAAFLVLVAAWLIGSL
jgi:hypothetical protein